MAESRDVVFGAMPKAIACAVLIAAVSMVEACWAPADAPLASTVADGVVGGIALAAAGIERIRRPDSRIGWLSAWCGVTWLLGTIWPVLGYVHRGAVIHLALCLRDGRLPGWQARVTVGFGYVTAVPTLAEDERIQLALAFAVLAAGLRPGRSPGVGSPRWLSTTLLATGTYAAALAFAAIERLAYWHADASALGFYDLAVITVVVLALVDLVSARTRRAGVANLVKALGALDRPSTVADVLGEAVGDRALSVGYRLPERECFVDEYGRPFRLHPLSGQVVSRVADSGGDIAIVVHRRDVLDDSVLIDAVTGLLRLAAATVRAQEATRNRLDDIAASRRRIAETADRERERIVIELREQVGPWLATAGRLADELAVVMVGAASAGLRLDVASVQTDLHAFAQGLHHGALTDAGLCRALELLPQVAALPTRIRAAQELSLSAAVEACAYFICLEGLANVGKHARAQHAYVEVSVRGDVLIVVVEDDGVGGADARRGQGLKRLQDRAGAAGGRLSVAPGSAGGTRLYAEIPCASDSRRSAVHHPDNSPVEPENHRI